MNIHEQELLDFICSVYNGKIKIEDTTILIPAKRFGIVFAGLFEHSESSGKGKFSHRDQSHNALKQDVTLINVFEDEWLNKKDIVQSIILYKLGILKKKIFARKCTIKEVSKHISKAFFETNHLQGNCGSQIAIGLYYENELVHCISFGKSRFNKHFNWEIVRDATKLNYQVVGGFQKALMAFLRTHKGSLITYADKRYFTGQAYEKAGFQHLRDSEPNYYYFKEDLNRFSRVKFQKHKLEKQLETYDDKLSEVENMTANNWQRIFDCGNAVYGLIR